MQESTSKYLIVNNIPTILSDNQVISYPDSFIIETFETIESLIDTIGYDPRLNFSTDFHIKFVPEISDQELKLERKGRTIIINDINFDFTKMSVGSTLPQDAISSNWFADSVERDNDGIITLTLYLPQENNLTIHDVIIVDKDGDIILPQNNLTEMVGE